MTNYVGNQTADDPAALSQVPGTIQVTLPCLAVTGHICLKMSRNLQVKDGRDESYRPDLQVIITGQWYRSVTGHNYISMI